MKKRLFALFLVVAMLAAFAVPVHADYYETRSLIQFWCDGLEAEYPLSSDASGEGWSWDTETATLTLRGYNRADTQITLNTPGVAVNVVVIGENALSEINVSNIWTYQISKLIFTGTGHLFAADAYNGVSAKEVEFNGPGIYCSGALNISKLTINAGEIRCSYRAFNTDDTKYTKMNGGKLIMDLSNNQGNERTSVYELWRASDSSDYEGLNMVDANGNPVTIEYIEAYKYGDDYYVAVNQDGSYAAYVEITPVGSTEPEPEPEPVNPFTDVEEGRFYYAPVLWAVEKGITAGKTATTFAPAEDCTRGQVVTFLWRAAGSPAPTSQDCPFTDVNPEAYYYNAMLWAVEKGITAGMSATEFAPNADCNRGQVVTFLWRAQGKPAPTTDTCNFIDVKPEAFYYDAMLWAVENQVTSGMSSTTFAPTTTCNRGQVVTFLNRTYE